MEGSSAIEWLIVVLFIRMRMMSIAMGVLSVAGRVMSMEVGEMSMARRVLSMDVLISRLMLLTQSSNLLLSRGRSSLNTFIQEGNWTSHPQDSSRRLILISVMRVR